jgi:hypothetical protein
MGGTYAKFYFCDCLVLIDDVNKSSFNVNPGR